MKKCAVINSRLFVGLSLLVCGLASPSIVAAVVIGNPSLPVSQLNVQQVSDLFLGKTKKLPDGTAVTVVDHQDGEPVKEEFYKNVIGKSPNQLKAYWAKIVFTGEGAPPKALAGDQAVKQHVATTPGAIGYVDDKVVDGSVKVLLKQ